MRAPMMSIHTVAAGGGSILEFDGARFRVGPQSAGANPGPASYRRGGPLAVTDANLMVGKLEPRFYPAIFGPDRDQPLDGESVRQGFSDLAARIGDGFINTAPDGDAVSAFKEKSGGKPAQGGVKVSWADTKEEGIDHAHRLWANAGLPGELAQVLPSPQHFEQASQLVTRESTGESIVAGNDVDEHVESLKGYVDAGYDEVYVANMGPNYLAMIEAYGRDVLPKLR